MSNQGDGFPPTGDEKAGNSPATRSGLRKAAKKKAPASKQAPPGGTSGTNTGGGSGGITGNNPTNVVFSLTPGRANKGLIDYSTKVGAYHWKGATYKLDEEPYDCDPEGLWGFLSSRLGF